MVKFTVQLVSKRRDAKEYELDEPGSTTVEELTEKLQKLSA